MTLIRATVLCNVVGSRSADPAEAIGSDLRRLYPYDGAVPGVGVQDLVRFDATPQPNMTAAVVTDTPERIAMITADGRFLVIEEEEVEV